MKVAVTIPLLSFREILDELTRAPHSKILWTVGVCRKREALCYLTRERGSAMPRGSRRLAFSVTERPLALADWSMLASREVVGEIAFHPESGKWWGAAVGPDGDLLPVEKLALVGPYMPTLAMSELEGQIFVPNIAHPEVAELKQYSRTIGALGLQAWMVLSSLAIAVVGCGRSGSLAAVTLAKTGARNLVLIDPDRVESHNLPEMDGVRPSDVGRFKVDVVSSFIQDHCSGVFQPGLTVERSPLVAAWRSALEADILVSCVDNDAARLACAILSTTYHLPMLDIGTGIFVERESGKRAMGADVRLIIPGRSCLKCLGGLVQNEAAFRELAGLDLPSSEPWWIERSGSSRALNAVAVHLGVLMLCDFLGGRIDESRWLQMECGEGGEISMRQTARRASDVSCTLCARAGMGDDGLYWGSVENKKK